MLIALARDGPSVRLAELDAGGRPIAEHTVSPDRLPAWVAERERGQPDGLRWVWADTARVYPVLLDAGVRVRRCHDLRLVRAILTDNLHAELAPAAPDGGDPAAPDPFAVAAPTEPGEPDLLDALEELEGTAAGRDEPDLSAVVAEFGRQWRAVETSSRAARLRLLVAAESVGALIAAELRHDGLPWDVGTHDATLTRLLGPRPRFGGRPVVLETLADRIRAALDAPTLNPDSPTELLPALRRAGLEAGSTRQHELEQLDHPVIPALLEYKKLSRLLAANGWAWMDSWVVDGRLRPEYLPGGVVTGRWATRGGGALQLPKQIRGAVRADPGWRLVVADAAQLEPRVLAAMAGDRAMAAAAQGADLYAALVGQGVVAERSQAKVAMLGALYGATSGTSGQLMPRLTRAYPEAIGLVEQAARDGEAYRRVSTWLGRCSPEAPESWRELHRRLVEGEADVADAQRSRRQSRDWGRFTRNFVVQGTAAEWALCWMGALRTALRELGTEGPGPGLGRPHLVYFLHDEVLVHTPAGLAAQVEVAIADAAAQAGRMLFGSRPVEFALDVRTVESYDEAA